MVVKRLKGQEALDYLKANPEARYKVINPGNANFEAVQREAQQQILQKQQQERGVVGSLLDSILSSATALPRTLINNRGLMTQAEKFRSAGSNPTTGLDRLIQSAADTGSFLVPGGLITRGLVGGALQSFGNQDLRNGIDVGNIATGAALGGALGGAGRIAGKIKNVRAQPARLGVQRATTLDELTDQITDAAIEGRLKPPVDQFGSTQLGGNALNRFKTIVRSELGGINPTTRGNMLSGVDDTVIDRARLQYLSNETRFPLNERGIRTMQRGLENSFDNLVINSGLPGVQVNSFINNAVKETKQFIPGVKISLGDVKQRASQILGDMMETSDDLVALNKFMTGTGNLAPAELHKIAKASYGAFQKLKKLKSTGAQIADVDIAAMAGLDRAARSVLREITGFQDLADLWQTLYRTAPSRGAAASSIQAVSQSGKPNIVGALVGSGGEIAMQGVDLLENIPNLARRAGDFAARTPAAGAFANVAGSRAYSRALPATIAGLGNRQSIAGMDTPEEVIGNMSQRATDIATEIFNKYEGTNIDYISMYQQALAQAGGNPSRANALFNVMSKQAEQNQTKLSQQDKVIIPRAASGLAGVGVLRDMLSNGSINAIAAQQHLPNFLRGKEAQIFDTAVEQAVDAIRRVMSGQQSSDKEAQRYIDTYSPRFGDNAETIEYKLNALEQFFLNALPRTF